MYGYMFTAHAPHLSVYASNWKIYRFSALLWQDLYIFAFVVSWLIYNHHVASYVGNSDFRKNQH